MLREPLQAFEGHNEIMEACAVSPDGGWFVTAARDGTLRIYDTAEGSVRALSGHVGPVSCCAIDPGFAVSPDGLVAQMESGIVYGLTAALYGEISIEGGAVRESNFHDYRMLRMHEHPEIEVSVIVSGEAWGGAGEPATPVIAPALVSAVYAATGKRVRELPLAKLQLG